MNPTQMVVNWKEEELFSTTKKCEKWKIGTADGQERILGYPSIGPGIVITYKPRPKMPSHLTQESPYSNQIQKHNQTQPPTHVPQKSNHTLPPPHTTNYHHHQLIPFHITSFSHPHLPSLLATTYYHYPWPIPLTTIPHHHTQSPHFTTIASSE